MEDEVPGQRRVPLLVYIYNVIVRTLCMLCQCHTRDACRLHAGCITTVCRKLHDAATCMQEVAGCSSMHAACMQAACSLHYVSSVAASTQIHVHIPGVDAVCRASTPCIPGSTPCTPASTKSCTDCRAFCEYDRMQEVTGCSRIQQAACRM